jgi:predicted phosphodiesterase
MKINLVSDAHLDVSGYLDMPGGEVLVLAGDICEARSMRRDREYCEFTTDQPQKSFPSSEFFRIECAKYKKVFMVMGNHEHYHGRLDKTYDELKEMLPSNVTLLENQVEEYNGVMFMGATLWTDLNKRDPLTAITLNQSMTDYRVIKNYYEEQHAYYKLTPEHTASLHFKTKDYFKSMLEEYADKQFVVITHHAPSFRCVNEKYKHDSTMNGGYASDMDQFIMDHPNIAYWVFGHMHDPVNFMIGSSTRVMSNPRGYLPYEADNGFDVNFTFEVH